MTTMLVDARTLTQPITVLDSDVPNIKTPAYERSQRRRQKCRDVFNGSEAIRDAGDLYLPQFAGESDDLYEARKTISALFNGYARTVLAAVGMLTQPEPVLSKEMPPALVDMAENVDGDGMHLAVFSRHLTKAAMIDGVAGILTEYPRANDPSIDRSKASAEATIALETGGELNAGDQKALNLRPYFILVKADEFLAVYETVNGKRTLVMFIRRVIATVRKNRFSLVNVAHYDVYELVEGKVTYERWTEPTGGGRPVLDTASKTPLRGLTAIPWSPLVAGDELGEGEIKPTLIDLADMNLTHHRIATGILSVEELACVPTLVRIGCPPISLNDDGSGNYPPVVNGPGNTIEVPVTPGVTLPQEPVYYLQVSSDVIVPATTSLDKCEFQMGAMGAAFLTPQLVAETATAHRMDSSAETASISSVSRGFKDCLESAFGFAGQYIKQPAGSVTVNEDFLGDGVDASLLTVLVTMYMNGALTLEEIRTIAHTGQFPENFDPADKKILEELMAQTAAKEAQKAIAAAAKNPQNAPPNGQGNNPASGQPGDQANNQSDGAAA